MDGEGNGDIGNGGGWNTFLDHVRPEALNGIRYSDCVDLKTLLWLVIVSWMGQLMIRKLNEDNTQLLMLKGDSCRTRIHGKCKRR